jgi:all-trans-retinol 13,14-reductase
MSDTDLKKNQIKSNYSEKNYYDLIIIGAGISGLSTGLMWLKNRPNTKVLIINKMTYPGGYITAYKKKGYVFETTQLMPDVIEPVKYMGLKLPLRRFKDYFMRRIIVDGKKVKEYFLPVGYEKYKEFYKKTFPEDASNIEKFLDYSLKMFSQVRKLKSLMTLADKIKLPFTAPKVLSNLNTTYSQYLDKFKINNPELRELLETFTSFAGVPPSGASAILTSGAMLTAVNGSYRPIGYFDELPSEMAMIIQNLGGEILLGKEVEKIIIKKGQATGVKISDTDRIIEGEKIITTIDPKVAMHKLVGDKNLPEEYVKKLNSTVMSTSSINISLGLDNKIDMNKVNIDYPYNVISTGLGTTEKLFNAFRNGENAFSKHCFHMAVICPSLTTGGKNTLTLRGVPFGMGEWQEWRNNDHKKYKKEKEKWGDFFIDLIESYLIPDIRKHIKVIDISTPATYARYSGSPTGSIYDIASLVTQFGPKRISMKTPIENLYQPKFAHGIYGGIMNGVQVVDLILNREFNNGNSLFSPVNQ